MATLTRTLPALAQQPQLCTNCNQKPRHAGYLYCSRTCATDASSATSSKLCVQCHQRPKFQGFDFCGRTCARAAQAAQPSQGTTKQPSVSRVAAALKNQFSQLRAPATVTQPLSSTPAPLARGHVAQLPLPPPQPLSQPTKCRIDDCWEPVETDAQGAKISEYCSEEHGEEAVLSGLAVPCVMCLKMPQSDSDYFCSRICKEQSMQK